MQKTLPRGCGLLFGNRNSGFVIDFNTIRIDVSKPSCEEVVGRIEYFGLWKYNWPGVENGIISHKLVHVVNTFRYFIGQV